jgi:hypothetical protein
MRSFLLASFVLLAIAALVAWALLRPPVDRPGGMLQSTSHMAGAVGSTESGETPNATLPVHALSTAADRSPAIASVSDGPELLPDAGLHGLVLGPDGAALAGAEVVLSASLAEGYALLDRELLSDRRELDRTRTDAAGAYRLRLEAGRQGFLVASSPGLVDAARSGCLAGSRVDLQLQRGAVVTGTVRRFGTGAGVPDTRLVFLHHLPGGGRQTVAEVRSDGAGLYRVQGLPPGAYDVSVQPKVLAAPRDLDLLLVDGTTTVRDVVLTEGLTIRGRVLDAETRQGIAGAEVGEGLAGRVVNTDAEGAFVLPGFASSSNLSLRVRAAGYGSEEPILRGRGSTPEDTSTTVEVLLHRGHRVRGIVHDAGGVALEGVYVAAVAADFGALGESFRSDWRSTRTASDGAFVIEDLRPDMPHALLLVRPGLATAVYEFPPDEAQRADLDLGVIRMLPSASLRGVVRDEHGKPVAAHEVRLSGHNRDRWQNQPAPAEGYDPRNSYLAERRCTTDDRGRFVFLDLAAGDYVVSASKFDSHDRIRVPRSVEAGAAENDLELVLTRGYAIDGRVFASDGEVVSKCYCSIDPEDGQGTNGDVEVRPDGTFHAGGLAAGQYTLTVYPYASEADRASGRSYESIRIEHVVAGASALRCEVPVNALVRGTLLDAGSSPVVGRWIAAFDGNQKLAAVTTAADGTFAMPLRKGLAVWVGVMPPPDPDRDYQRSEVEVGVDAVAGGEPVLLLSRDR